MPRVLRCWRISGGYYEDVQFNTVRPELAIMMLDNPFGLPPAAVEKIRGVFARYPQVEKAVLYGLRAKGNYKNGSDIDLTLYGDELNLGVLLKILDELDDPLLPWMIDLSIFDQIDNVKLREHIERVGVIFYQRSTAAEGKVQV